MKKVYKTTAHRAHVLISARQDFKTGGAIRGANTSIPDLPYGHQLPEEWREPYLTSGATYVVWSYATPIAWWSEESGWTRPEVRYSPTTSHHQGQCPMTTSAKCSECGQFAPEYTSKVHGDECSLHPGSDAWHKASGF